MNTQLKVTEQPRIKRGDTVEIKCKGLTVVGQVLSSDGDWKMGWMLEVESEVHGYRYWKQMDDGGSVTVLEVAPEPPTLAGILRTHRDHCKELVEFWDDVKRALPDSVASAHPRHDFDGGFGRTWDVYCPGFPIVSVYFYGFFGPKGAEGSEVLLVGEEASEFWAFIYDNMPKAEGE